MEILIENQQNKITITENIKNILNTAAELSIKLQNLQKPSEISFMLVDNERIREINLEYRNIDRPTDVLSFPILDMYEGMLNSDEGDIDLDENLLLLGDIVISMEMAVMQAEEYGHSLERELAFLATHGTFHLLGYDHEDEESEKKMMQLQETVLHQMGLSR